MKYLIFLLALTTLSISLVYSFAGQSACRDPSEIGQTYPHHFEHSKYWYCENLNEPAIEKDCAKGYGYLHKLGECIPWANWVWKPPVNPPTLA